VRKAKRLKLSNFGLTKCVQYVVISISHHTWLHAEIRDGERGVKYTIDGRTGWMSTSIINFSTWNDEYNVKYLRHCRQINYTT